MPIKQPKVCNLGPFRVRFRWLVNCARNGCKPNSQQHASWNPSPDFASKLGQDWSANKAAFSFSSGNKSGQAPRAHHVNHPTQNTKKSKQGATVSSAPKVSEAEVEGVLILALRKSSKDVIISFCLDWVRSCFGADVERDRRRRASEVSPIPATSSEFTNTPENIRFLWMQPFL